MKKWTCKEVKKKETVIPEKEMKERLESVWELLQPLDCQQDNLPKADSDQDVVDSKTRSAS